MQPNQVTLDPQEVLRWLHAYRYRWAVPALITLFGAVFYAAFIYQPRWEASTALVVRDEALGSYHVRAGQFASADSMKSAQESILELARSHGVVRAALVDVGPPDDYPARKRPHWPTLKDVEGVQQAVSVRAPNGAEFGKTEIFYLSVADVHQERAVEMADAICRRLDERLRSLRERRAHSLVAELSNVVAVARADLQEATQGLSEVEQRVGSDLPELRVLNETASGEGNLRQVMVLIRNDLRDAVARRRTTERLRELLKAAQQDPEQLVATPNQLLESESALRQLKDGLVEAQLNKARLRGQMSDQHPLVRAALIAEQQIRQNLHAELAGAVRALEADLDIQHERIEAMMQQLAEVTDRMNLLATMRADYSNLVADVARRSEVLNNAERELSEARASQAAALSVSLITQLDEPQTGSRPEGPGRTMIAASGLFGGLLLGLGLVIITAPAPTRTAVPTGAASPQTATAENSGGVHPWPAACRACGAGGRRGLTLQQALDRVAV